jgi:hypothetical protein
MDTSGDENEKIRARYIPLLEPLFFPKDPVGPDIIKYFASLLRVVGLEDKGWDPYQESRAVIDDLYALMQIELPRDRFPERDLTNWRLGLLFYNHIVEMDAPYEVLANLLRFQVGRGYSPNPFHELMTAEERKRFKRSGFFPRQKIEILKRLDSEAGTHVGTIFDEFYRGNLRNAMSHSDFIFADEGFRCRNGNWRGSFRIGFDELDDLLTKAKVFIGTFFALEREARRLWGGFAGKAIPYDSAYKGLMEVLADDSGLMNGFKIHWPNRSESTYRRTEDGIDMVNCMLDFKHSTISLMVGMYARQPSEFSPLVEMGSEPSYTAVEGSSDDLALPADI